MALVVYDVIIMAQISDTIRVHFSGRITIPTRAGPTICCLFVLSLINCSE